VVKRSLSHGFNCFYSCVLSLSLLDSRTSILRLFFSDHFACKVTIRCKSFFSYSVPCSGDADNLDAEQRKEKKEEVKSTVQARGRDIEKKKQQINSPL
jgi:hypothetical protein